MDEGLIIRENFILILLGTLTFIAIFCFVRKLYLWLKIPSGNKIGFITSFVVFFSIHDIHNSRSPQLKKFHRANNWLNAFFWTSLLAFAIVMVFNTDDASRMIKKRGSY